MESRYLKRRGRRWYFQIAVPANVQKHVGQKVIVEALNTDDLREARQLRWGRLAAAHARFENAVAVAGLTAATIEREAQATLTRLLREADMATNRGDPLQWAAPEAAANGDWPEGTTEGEGLAFAAETFADAMTARSYDLVEVEAAAVVISLDLEQDPDDEALDKLCQSQLAAHHEAIKARIAALRGTNYDAQTVLTDTLREIHGSGGLGTPGRRWQGRAPAGSRNNNIAADGLTISEAAAACLAGHEHSWSPATLRQYKTSLRLFAYFKFDRMVSDVTIADARQFIGSLSKLDPAWHRAAGAQALGFDALIRQHATAALGGASGGLSRKTIDRHVAACSALFTWAIAAQKFTGDNPFEGLYGAGGGAPARPIAALAAADIAALINAGTATTPDSVETALYWAIHLAVFCGLRQREICQLRPQDVVEADGVWAVYAGAGPRRRGRLVPLHTALLSHGFLNHWRRVESQGSALLLPALTDHRPGQGAARLSRAMAQRNAKAGLRQPAGFRALRASARNALAAGNVPDHLVGLLLGDGQRSRRANSTLPAPQTLAAAIDRIGFDHREGGV